MDPTGNPETAPEAPGAPTGTEASPAPVAGPVPPPVTVSPPDTTSSARPPEGRALSRWRAVTGVLGVAVCGLVLGAMLGTAALGVVHAAARAEPAAVVSARVIPPPAPQAPPEGDHEGEGDSEGQAPSLDVRQRQIGAGGVLATTLAGLGVTAQQSLEVASALGRVVEVRALRATDVVVTMRDPGEGHALRRVVFRRSTAAEWVLEPDDQGSFHLAQPSDDPDGADDSIPEDGGVAVAVVAPESASARVVAPSPSLPPGVIAPVAPQAHLAITPRGEPTRGRRAVVTSDDIPEGPAMGYLSGRPLRIRVTRVDGKPVELSTAQAYRRMAATAARAGIRLRVVSGFRTMEHQRALYAAYLRGRGNLAALPGHSHHQSGHALDLNTSTPGVLSWLNRHAREYGFRRTVPTEAWHWERW